jgi:putative oxidoreductase
MKKLFSSKYSAGAFSTAMFALRLGIGVLMLMHGYGKLTHFAGTAEHMPVLLGISKTIAAALLIFAEFFCSLFLILGLFTRLATIPLIIATCVMVFKSHHGDIFGDGEHAALYLVGYIVLLLVGPGRASVDSMIGK